MKNIARAVGGAGLSISGVLMCALVLSRLDWRRVENYGIVHEISLYGTVIGTIFVVSIVFILCGVWLILYGAFGKDNEK